MNIVLYMLLGLTVSVTQVLADEINVHDRLQNLLDNDQKKFYGIPPNAPVPNPPRTATTPLSGPMWFYVKNEKLIPLNILFTDSGDSAIPDNIFRVKYLAYNCSNQPQDIKGNLTNEYFLSRNAVLISNIKSGSKVSMGIPIGNTGATLGFDKTFNIEVGNTVTTKEEKKLIDSQEINQTIPPYINRIYIMERIENTGYFYFKGTVLADAETSPVQDPNNTLPSAGLLSEMLKAPEFKDPKLRTFDIAGYTWNVNSITKSLYWIDSPLSASECESLKTKNSVVSPSLNKFTDNESQFTVSPMYPGMTVTTSNIKGDISVRAKTSGNTPCKVTFTTFKNSIDVLVSPGGWSDWTVLESHNKASTVSVNFAIEQTPECFANVEPQIQYLREM